MAEPADPSARPAVLRRTAALLALEALALAVLGLVLVVRALVGDPDDRAGSVLLGVLVLAAGLVLLPVARGLDRARGWAWAPTVLLQVLGLVAAVDALQGGAPPVGLVIGLVAVSVLYQLATPEARAAYVRGQG